MQDAQGLEVTTTSRAAVEAVDAFREELLSLGPGIPDVIAAADAHPDCPILAIYAAQCGLFDQTAEGDRIAGEWLARAERTIGEATRRERLLLEAAQTCLRGHYDAAAGRLERLIAEYPRDLVAAKTLEFLYYVKGQHYCGPRFLAAMESIRPDNAGSGLFLSMYSFAQELCGRYDAACRSAEGALELAPYNPWATHTLSHVLLKTGRIADGIAALERDRSNWRGEMPRSHNNWHLALLHLEALDHAAAQAFLRDPILVGEPLLTVQKIDAVSLLWRLEMAGHEVPEEDWDLVADLVADDAPLCYTGFNSAHFLYALARAGRGEQAADARARIGSAVAATDGDEARVWHEVGLPLLDASIAFAEGDHAGAVARLGPIAGELWRVGGSDAQVDLFRQTYLLGLIGNGEKAAARAWLDAQFATTPATPLQERWRSLT